MSAGQLRAKAGRTMVGRAVAGHRKFLHALDYEGKGKIIPAQVLPVLQGKGLERKEAFLLTSFIHQLLVFIGVHYLATLGLWLLFYQEKSNKPLPAANERANVIRFYKRNLV